MRNLILSALILKKYISLKEICLYEDIDLLKPRDIMEWLRHNANINVSYLDLVYYIERIYYIGVEVAAQFICKTGGLSPSFVTPLSHIKIDSSEKFINKYLKLANIKNVGLFHNIFYKVRKSILYNKIDYNNVEMCLKIKLHTNRLKIYSSEEKKYYCVECNKEEISKDECLCDRCYRIILVSEPKTNLVADSIEHSLKTYQDKSYSLF